MNEDILKIFNGVDLSEEVKNKISSLIETTVEERVEQKTQAIEEEIENKYAKLAENYSEYVFTEMQSKTDEYISEEVIPNVAKYVSYAAKEYVSENKVELESQVKVNLAESFLSGISNVAEGFNVEVPVGSENIIAEAEQKNADLQNRVDQLVGQNEKLQETISESKRQSIFEAVSDEMTETRKERFKEASAKITFIDESQFKDALTELKESFVPHKKDEQITENKDEVAVDETVTESKSNSYMTNLFSRI